MSIRIERDAANRKEMPELSGESMEELQIIYDGMTDGVLIACLETGKPLRMNSPICRMFGYEEEELMTLPITDIYLAEMRNKMMERFVPDATGNEIRQHDVPCLRKNGTVFYADVVAKAVIFRGAPAIVGFFRDVTARKKLEEELVRQSERLEDAVIERTLDLREKEELLRSYIETAGSVIVTLSLDNGIIEFNREAEQIYGIKRTYAIGKDYREFFVPKAKRREFDRIIASVLSGNPLRNFESDVVTTSGDKQVILWNADRVVNARGEIVGVISVGQNITKRKLAEESLRESEERFRSAIEEAPFPVMIYAEDGEVIMISKTFTELTGYSLEEMPTLSEWMQKASGEKFPAIKQNPAQLYFINGKVDEGEYMVRTSKGVALVWHVSSSPLGRLGDGRRLSISMANDVTVRKMMEEELKASLAEKDILLREIHHRVKNNMQVILSLIGLQEKFNEDATFINMLKESQNRIKSMSLVHEKLYSTKNLDKIDFHDYVTRLAGELFAAFGVYDCAIGLNVDISGVYLSIDTAIPCGLIINEIISNSLKHAFKNSGKDACGKDATGNVAGIAGSLYVSAHNLGNGDIEILIGDDGTGFKDGLDVAGTKSLGLHIVNLLVKQLRGTIECDNKKGTHYTIRFGI
ncbi:MAG: PAS domain S-box protein [Nitrospirae bacterium]|nr:PAS domain S-box protein [Nitrospirota bacterium]